MRTSFVLLTLLFLISACGGGSNNDDLGDSAGNTRITGQVIDAANRSPIPGVEVSSDDLTITALTAADGRFDFGPVASDNNIDLQFSLDGYQSALYAQPPTTEASNDLGEVQLISNDNLGSGSIGGTLTDSQGNPLAGVLLRFVSGINAIDGTALVSTTTDAQGIWSVTGLEAGNYTCIIFVDDEEPVVETVQILGGVDAADANVVVPVASDEPTSELPFIDLPEDREHDEYGAGDVTWSYFIYEYSATSGTYTVNRNDRIGSNFLLFFGTGSFDPIQWSQSNVVITHTFAGAGTYPIVVTGEELLSAAEENRPAARIRVTASGPQLTVGVLRFTDYITAYVPAASGEGSISVSVDTQGRYRFDASSLNLIRQGVSDLEPHPDAPSSIVFDLSNGYVP